MLLTHRKLLVSKAIAIENDLRATLRNFGLKVGMVGKVNFEARIRELVENLPDLAVLVEPLLVVRRVLREQIGILHRRLLAIVRDDVTGPPRNDAVGPVARVSRHRRRAEFCFRNSKAVGASFGLTPAHCDSGERGQAFGDNERCVDAGNTVMLYEAAHRSADLAPTSGRG